MRGEERRGEVNEGRREGGNMSPIAISLCHHPSPISSSPPPIFSLFCLSLSIMSFSPPFLSVSVSLPYSYNAALR